MDLKQAQLLKMVPELQRLLASADYFDAKIVTGKTDLRSFVAGLFNYRPAWLLSLYGLRQIFARFLGLRKDQPGFGDPLRPDTIPMQAGKLATFFTVSLAKEDCYWFAENRDKHLTATLGVVVEPGEGADKRFWVVTIVHHHRWTGHFYLQMIKPFHHLVVHSMAHAALKSGYKA